MTSQLEGHRQSSFGPSNEYEKLSSKKFTFYKEAYSNLSKKVFFKNKTKDKFSSLALPYPETLEIWHRSFCPVRKRIFKILTHLGPRIFFQFVGFAVSSLIFYWPYPIGQSFTSSASFIFSLSSKFALLFLAAISQSDIESVEDNQRSNWKQDECIRSDDNDPNDRRFYTADSEGWTITNDSYNWWFKTNYNAWETTRLDKYK